MVLFFQRWHAHARRLMSPSCNNTQVYLVDKGSVRLLAKGVDEYTRQIRRRNKALSTVG